MSKKSSSIIGTIISIVVTVAVFVGFYFAYKHLPAVHSVFVTPDATQQVVGEVAQGSAQSIAAKKEFVGFVVFCIFAGMISFQVFSFGLAMMISRGIMNSATKASNKLKKFDNAGIFFDLPLYSGLFGTVASFMVISFSRESSLLIAYSTTLIGIVSSVILHIAVLYPAKRKLLNENN